MLRIKQLVMLCVKCDRRLPIRQFVLVEKQKICEGCYLSPEREGEMDVMAKNDIDVYIYDMQKMDTLCQNTKAVPVDVIKRKGLEWIDKMLEKDLTKTKAGSISHLLYGEKPSEQSINIKLGRLGEFIAQELILSQNHLELLKCGIQKINNKNKDIDLIFKDETTNTIYYRELKGNIELDTEKLPATISKCLEIYRELATLYPDYTIDCGILNWSVYDRKILTAGLHNIKAFETGGVKIDHMRDFLGIIGVEWGEIDYYTYFREIGCKIKNKFA